MIKVTNLHKAFSKNTVLKGVNLNIQEGQIIGLVGANGAGKTTLFRSIAGLEQYNEGEILIEENCLPIGLLLSNPDFLSFMTAEEYLTFMCEARKITHFDVKESNLFDLPLSKYAANFSTGMKKKLALTALLMQKNNFFILDEPFSGVDFESNLIINYLIQELQKAGKTILISSHILSSLTDICDEIHFLKAGVIEKSVVKAEFSAIQESLELFEFNEKVKNVKF